MRAYAGGATAARADGAQPCWLTISRHSLAQGDTGHKALCPVSIADEDDADGRVAALITLPGKMAGDGAFARQLRRKYA